MDEDYTREEKVPKLSVMQTVEFIAWMTDNYQTTHEDDVFMSVNDYGETYTRRELVNLYLNKFNIG